MESADSTFPAIAAACERLAIPDYLLLLRWVRDHNGSAWGNVDTKEIGALELAGDQKLSISPYRLPALLAKGRKAGLFCSTKDNPTRPLLYAERLKNLVHLIELFGPSPLTREWIRERAEVVGKRRRRSLPPSNLGLIQVFSTERKIRFIRAMLGAEGTPMTLKEVVSRDQELATVPALYLVANALIKGRVVEEAGKILRENTYRLSTKKLEETIDLVCFLIVDLGLLDEPSA
jgi:hypothetical protein